jgi:hypothetical protein
MLSDGEPSENHGRSSALDRRSKCKWCHPDTLLQFGHRRWRSAGGGGSKHADLEIKLKFEA